VLDDHSRYLIALAATGGTHGEPVQQQLEEAFQRCGVPEAMLMDHGTPWWSTHAQFGRTHLSLWLMRQGIRLCWSGIRHPQTQGKVERFHGSLQRAWERRGVPSQNWQAWLDAYRWEHNHVRPHEALDMQTPATLWKPSLRCYDPHPPRWEYPLGAWVLKVDCQGKLDIKGKKWKINRSLAGEWVQVIRVDVMIIDNLHTQGVEVGMSGHFLVGTVGFDAERRYTTLALVHSVVERKDVRFLGKLDAAHIDFPCAFNGALRHRQRRHKQ
jgi:hypothetical protein